MDDFIPKPVRIDDLSAALLRWRPDDRLSARAAAVVDLRAADVAAKVVAETVQESLAS